MALRRRASVIVPVLLILLGSLLLAPATALAGGRGHRGFAGRQFGGHHFRGHQFSHHHFAGAQGKFVFGGSDFFSDRLNGLPFGRCCFKKSFGHNPFFFSPIVPYAVDSSPVVYAPPPVIYAPTVIAASPEPAPAPVAYAPVAGVGTVSVAPAPEPMPRVVEHPTGRYELRGDGVTTSYTWVWIPNPPPGPPEAVAPAQGQAGERPPARRTQVYKWTDAQGVEHWTDRRPDDSEEPRPPA